MHIPTRRRRRGRFLAIAVAGASALTGLATTASASSSDTASTSTTYVLLYNAGASSAGAAKAVAAAGGTLVANYTQIGVAVARSSSATFESNVEAAGNVQAAATTNLGVYNGSEQDTLPEDVPVVPPSDSEPLAGLQWDMAQIHAFEAHDITGGSPDVAVGDLDTGLDFTHPDLAPNYDAANSTDCSGGTPAPLVVGNDRNGHGTHTAGTIAAAVNGVGITGVAPNVKIAGIKSSNDDGYFFPEMVICAYMWVATHEIDVTNNSYFADPWLFNCVNDREQRAIWNAESRAIRYAQSKGTVVVASEGNEGTDLSHPAMDVISPDFLGRRRSRPRDHERLSRRAQRGTGRHRRHRNRRSQPEVVLLVIRRLHCRRGAARRRSPLPGHGRSGERPSPVDLPGGCQLLAEPHRLRPRRQVLLLQGTSMAGPQVAGVAALVISHTGKTGGAAAATLKAVS